jgi:NADPH:quinone reductase-like Zn-dependent oxidoreductase
VLVGGGIGRDTGGNQTLNTLRTLALVTVRSLFARFLRQRIRMFVAKANRSDLELLAQLCEAGKVRPVVGHSYPLAQAAEAVRCIEDGHPRGKFVVTP